jgi:hypothetical protein
MIKLKIIQTNYNRDYTFNGHITVDVLMGAVCDNQVRALTHRLMRLFLYVGNMLNPVN